MFNRYLCISSPAEEDFTILILKSSLFVEALHINKNLHLAPASALQRVPNLWQPLLALLEYQTNNNFATPCFCSSIKLVLHFLTLFFCFDK